MNESPKRTEEWMRQVQLVSSMTEVARKIMFENKKTLNNFLGVLSAGFLAACVFSEKEISVYIMPLYATSVFCVLCLIYLDLIDAQYKFTKSKKAEIEGWLSDVPLEYFCLRNFESSSASQRFLDSLSVLFFLGFIFCFSLASLLYFSVQGCFLWVMMLFIMGLTIAAEYWIFQNFKQNEKDYQRYIQKIGND